MPESPASWPSPAAVNKQIDVLASIERTRRRNRLIRIAACPGFGLAVSCRGQIPRPLFLVFKASEPAWERNPALHSTWLYRGSDWVEELSKLHIFLEENNLAWEKKLKDPATEWVCYSPSQLRHIKGQPPLPPLPSPATTPPVKARRRLTTTEDLLDEADPASLAAVEAACLQAGA